MRTGSACVWTLRSLIPHRSLHGIIEFAEELQIIRDTNLYPGAKQQPDAWKSYCATSQLVMGVHAADLVDLGGG